MKPILLVDDRHDILSFLMWELKQHEVLCMQADNTQDAIDLLNEIEFEIEKKVKNLLKALKRILTESIIL